MSGPGKQARGIDGSYVYARLPRAGIGNKLVVWAHAAAFARAHDLPLMVTRWTNPVSIGPLLRREQRLRFYNGRFENFDDVGALEGVAIRATHQRVYLERATSLAHGGFEPRGRLYTFAKMPHWSNVWGGLHEHRIFLRERLMAMLKPNLRAQVEASPAPVVGLHVRLGDYARIAPGQDFSKLGLTSTPMEFFRNIVEGVRAVRGAVLPVTVFSDGSDEELAPLLSMPEVRRSPNQVEIVDLLQLAKSQILVPSAGSTFSEWSGFISGAPMLRHPAHIHAPIRGRDVNDVHYEGAVSGASETWPELLRENIRQVTLG